MIAIAFRLSHYLAGFVIHIAQNKRLIWMPWRHQFQYTPPALVMNTLL